MIVNRIEQARFNMVQQQIRPWEVLDERVLDLLTTQPREAFVPEVYQGLAYADIEIPLGDGQSMMFPRVEARLLQALDIRSSDRILEIGTGSGYLTSCLAKLGSTVISLDIRPALSERAAESLAANDVTNAQLRIDDAFAGEIPGGPFDAIAVTGSLPAPNDALKRLLAIGGRLFVVTGNAPAMEASLITRTGETSWRTEGLFETRLTPLDNAPQPDRFEF